MSREQFAALLGQLAVSKQRTLDDETLEVYYVELMDIPYPIIQAAIGRLIAREGGFIPSVGDIRAACDRSKPRASLTLMGDEIRKLLPSAAGALPDNDPRTWYACVTCRDTGWAEFWCPGPGNEAMPEADYVRAEACGRCKRFGRAYPGHPFAQRCLCYGTNRVIQARRESKQRYASGDAA